MSYKSKDAMVKRFIRLKNQVNGHLDILQQYITANQFRDLTSEELEYVEYKEEDLENDLRKIKKILQKIQRGEYE